MTTAQQLIMPVLARVFVAATWYDTANVRSTLYCKAREVIVGDRAEKMAQDEIDGGGVYEEAKRISMETGGDSFRVIDRRLQALRKRGVIEYTTKDKWRMI